MYQCITRTVGVLTEPKRLRFANRTARQAGAAGCQWTKLGSPLPLVPVNIQTSLTIV